MGTGLSNYVPSARLSCDPNNLFLLIIFFLRLRWDPHKRGTPTAECAAGRRTGIQLKLQKT